MDQRETENGGLTLCKEKVLPTLCLESMLALCKIEFNVTRH